MGRGGPLSSIQLMSVVNQAQIKAMGKGAKFLLPQNQSKFKVVSRAMVFGSYDSLFRSLHDSAVDNPELLLAACPDAAECINVDSATKGSKKLAEYARRNAHGNNSSETTAFLKILTKKTELSQNFELLEDTRKCLASLVFREYNPGEQVSKSDRLREMLCWSVGRWKMFCAGV